MYDEYKNLRTALSTILPTYYELFLSKDSAIPCISYIESNNAVSEEGDTIGYSNLAFNIKIWAHSIDEIQGYAVSLDNKMRELGFKRTATNEMVKPNSTLIAKVFTYEGKSVEYFS